MRLRDVVRLKRRIEGDKADYKTQVKDKELEFTDWGPFENKYGKGFLFQFWENGKPFVFITHSKCLEDDAPEWEREKGKEPFTAVVTEVETEDGKTAYVFR